LALLLRWLSSQASLGDKPNIWIKQFSAAETLGASSVSFLEAVVGVSIVEDISVCSFHTCWGLKG